MEQLRQNQDKFYGMGQTDRCDVKKPQFERDSRECSGGADKPRMDGDQDQSAKNERFYRRRKA